MQRREEAKVLIDGQLGIERRDLSHVADLTGAHRDAWRNGLSAYLGVTVSGFPNFFMLLGPNTGLGHNSVVLMIEAQVRYVINCLKLMRKRKISAMEVRAESQKHFAANLRDHMARTVWQSGGCRSWYQDTHTGENTTLWPGSVIQYFRATRSVSLSEYDLTPARPEG